MKSDLNCRACVIFCIDFRLHGHLSGFLALHGLDREGADVVRVAGAAKNAARPQQSYARDFIVDQLEGSRRLHDVREIYLVNHEDCGAYGLGKGVDAAAELMIHKRDLQHARTFLRGRFPDARIFAFYLRLDGSVEPIK